ncbi:hypothetical protein JOL79_31095 [Microbispora sp. RL4-1S]|uniref:Uncharacterized protein n=1 Tax=Microbispora oryzae TaxID=2806554 RepID=A0A941AL61_9ACTN|nr:hypothetical protein [Microbispora oryzae]MBP2708235.1 hypothetical protein [Microbispora oryzae]
MRIAGYALGGGLILLGLAGLALNAGQADPLSWALWFGGGVVAHDFVLVPVTLALGVPLRRVPRPYRVGLVVAAMITLVSLPVVLGFGRRADNPSQLPLDYGRNLAAVLLGVAVAAVAADAWTRLRRRRHGRAAPPSS